MPELRTTGARLRKRASSSVGVAMGLRAAVASVLAWVVGAQLGGIADDYLYYAPFGAVVAVSTTVMSSVKTSTEIFLAIALGAVVGVGVQELGLPSAAGVGTVVLVGTLVSRLRWLGASGSWVPIAGLFVLILGNGHESSFVLGYLGLTTLGAAVGTAVNVAFPPLLLDQTERAQDGLRRALVGQLDRLASNLEGGALPEPADASALAGELLVHGRAVEDLAGQALDGPPINWRVRRWRTKADHLRGQGAAMVALALLVGQLAHTLRRWEVPDDDEVALFRTELHVPAAAALRATALALSSETEKPEEAVAEAHHRIDELTDAIRRTREDQGDDLFDAGALVLGLRGTLAKAQGQ